MISGATGGPPSLPGDLRGNPARSGPGFGDPFPAPAKINRFLHITGRRADGYHELQTVFQFLDLADELRFLPRPSGQLELLAPPGLDGRDNLCLRAAELLLRTTGEKFGVSIALHKVIPVGGGLGGGSSDAATTLVALNHLFGLGLSAATLAQLGLRLGADVPIFVRGGAAWAEGVGENLHPVDPDTPWALVLDPGVTVATGAMFASGALTRDCPPETISASGYDRWGNVFEPVVRQAYPEIDRALVWLQGWTDSARLSGSGGCVFGLFADRVRGVAVQAACPAPWRCWLVRLLNTSPLLAALSGVAVGQPS